MMDSATTAKGGETITMAKEYIEREAAKSELLFWLVLAVSVAGVTLSEHIRSKKNSRR